MNYFGSDVSSETSGEGRIVISEGTAGGTGNY